MTKNRQFRCHQNGLSLVEVVVSMGIMGILVLSLGAIIKNVVGVQVTTEGRAAGTEFLNSLGKYIGTSNTCKTEFNGKTYPPASGPYVFSNNFINAMGGTGLAENDKVARSVYVDKLVWRDKGLPSKRILKGTSEYLKYMSTMEITLKITGKDHATQSRKRSIDFAVIVNGTTNRVDSCFNELNLTPNESCAGIGGVYNPSTQSCDSNTTSCEILGSYIQVICKKNGVLTSSSECANTSQPISSRGNPLAGGAATCPAGATATFTGQFSGSYSQSCGKKCSSNFEFTENFYTCLKCP